MDPTSHKSAKVTLLEEHVGWEMDITEAIFGNLPHEMSPVSPSHDPEDSFKLSIEDNTLENEGQ